ncbi:globin domain-containing protein [Kribbella sp. VKM Ac-2568]|uniref:globin domain-containing protein n=1 Tax=Kribbella sp. VKM Ac-2568 TaxID=2512219 RepID=UPI00104AFDC5|nr:globin domain-containing protein [Kribbella sp. VKM Ac-2568]TCM51824.1 nitric oxide dioxygenase [Kribbella sp. VKM Ac-2568]
MLSAQSTQVVKATLPVIGAAIDEITPIFYRRMFAAHPDLERDLFNRGNQAQGDQQRALAGAIAAYATLLVSDNAPTPKDLLARIAHKHASLGIAEDQYAIVHKHLFDAIVEVLGDAVTPEVAAAWDEVYWQMANDLIAIEKELYAEAGVQPAQVWRTVVVRTRVQESPDTVSFVLASPDGRALPTARPGQYISVACTLPDGARQIRQYSLTRAHRADEWAISVKAILASRADDGSPIPEGEVSNFLHRSVFESDVLTVSPPFGDLVLDTSDSPLLLVSAGIGSTPIIGMLHYLTHTASPRDVMVLHADRSPARHAHRQELKELVDQLPAATLHRWYEDLGVRPTRDDLLAGLVDLDAVDIPIDAQVYLCGPLPFMESVHSSLIACGLPEANIRYEVFGPDKWLATV